jgi:hypothetical protein
MATERCERCRKQRLLKDFRLNQTTVQRICASCLKFERDRRSATAVASGAGRPPRSPSQLEDQLWKAYLNSPDSKILEIWLATEGYTGTRGEMLKRYLLALIAAFKAR